MLDLLKCLDKFHRQHQKIDALLVELENIAGTNVEFEHIVAVMERVLDFTQEHFRDEEEIMQRLCYPRMAEHQMQHAEFVEKVKKLCFPVGNQIIFDPVDELLHCFRDWSAIHIATEDSHLDEFIKKTIRDAT